MIVWLDEAPDDSHDTVDLIACIDEYIDSRPPLKARLNRLEYELSLAFDYNFSDATRESLFLLLRR